MKKLIIVILSLVSIAYGQRPYTPEEMNVLNRFAPPLRDTIGAALKIGEQRTRPQDNKPYWYGGAGVGWYTFPTVGGGTYTGSSPISIDVSNVISMTPAGTAAEGYVTTGAQSFAGAKTFTSGASVLTSGTNSGYFQLTNSTSGNNFQFGLAATNIYGTALANTGYLYNYASNGMAFINDLGGSFKFSFGSSTSSMFEVNSGYVKVGNTWNLPLTAGTNGYVLTSNGTGGSTWSPGGGGGGAGTLNDVLTAGNTSGLTIGLTGYHTGGPSISAGQIHLQSYSAENNTIAFQSYFNGTAWLRAETGVPYFMTASGGDLTYYNGSTGSIATTFTPVERLRMLANGGLKINNAYTLPNAVPSTNGYVLTGNTDGTTSWAAGGGGSSQWATLTGNTISYTGGTSHTGASIISPVTGTAAYLRVLSFDGVDTRVQSNGSESFIGTVSNHPLAIVSNSVTGLALSTAGVVSLPALTGSITDMVTISSTGVLGRAAIPGGGGSGYWTAATGTGAINYASGKVGIGTNSGTPGQLLDIHQNQNAGTGFQISNTTAGTGALAFGNFISDASTLQLGSQSSTTTAYGQLAAGATYEYSSSTKHVTAIDNASGRYVIAVGAGVATERLGVSAAGAVTFNSAYTFPTTAAPTNGYVLTGNTDGSMSWAANGSGGGVTSVSGSGGSTGLTLTGGPITSTGTLTLGGTLAAANGGTGQSSYTTGDLLYASSSSALSRLAAGTSGYYLGANGAGAAPSWKVMPGSGQDATYATFDVVTTNATETTMNGSMQVSNGEYGMIEVSIYNVNSLSNAGYSRKFILPYRGTSTTAVAIGAQDDIQTERAWGSLGFEDCDMTVVSNGAGDIIITVFGISGQSIQWRAEIKKYSVFWSA